MSPHESSRNFIDIFFGHTHGDQFSVRHDFMCTFSLADFGQIQIYYANNATNINADTALTASWIGPSVTPLSNLNSGFRVYEVDSAVCAAQLFSGPRVSFFGSFNFLYRHSKFSMRTREFDTPSLCAKQNG